MKRKVTGWFLFMLMTVFTVTAHSSLRYCLCNEAITLGECYCEQVPLLIKKQHTSSCDCCGSCKQTESNTQSLKRDLCFDCDCMVDIVVQLDDFVLTSGDMLNNRLDSKDTESLFCNYQDHTIPSIVLTSAVCAPRGSPPLINRLNVPIYLRDSAYRI